LKRRAKMAVARPAAPAPTTATSYDSENSLKGTWVYRGARGDGLRILRTADD
jgi:hypothetical protein